MRLPDYNIQLKWLSSSCFWVSAMYFGGLGQTLNTKKLRGPASWKEPAFLLWTTDRNLNRRASNVTAWTAVTSGIGSTKIYWTLWDAPQCLCQGNRDGLIAEASWWTCKAAEVLVTMCTESVKGKQHNTYRVSCNLLSYLFAKWMYEKIAVYYLNEPWLVPMYIKYAVHNKEASEIVPTFIIVWF